VSSILRVFAAVAALGALALVTGCATKGTSYATPTTQAASAPAQTAAAPAPTVAMTPVPQASGQLTGTQLQQVLLPAADFPAGFTLTQSSAVSSGGALSSGPAQFDLATVSCADFVSHLGNTGFGETAMAADSYTAQAQAFDQVVYQFPSAAAATAFVDGIATVAGRCHSFTATDNGATGTFSLTATPAAAVAGHPSLELVQSGTIGGSELTLDTLLSASGVDVFAGSAVGLGTSAPAGLAKQTIVYSLMKRQAAAAELG
jgi:hypothetical protein